MPAADTTIDVARRQRAIFASKSPAERVAMVEEMSALVRDLAMNGIRRRNPGIDDQELMIRLIERMHGRELAQAAEAAISTQRGG